MDIYGSKQKISLEGEGRNLGKLTFFFHYHPSPTRFMAETRKGTKKLVIPAWIKNIYINTNSCDQALKTWAEKLPLDVQITIETTNKEINRHPRFAIYYNLHNRLNPPALYPLDAIKVEAQEDKTFDNYWSLAQHYAWLYPNNDILFMPPKKFNYKKDLIGVVDCLFPANVRFLPPVHELLNIP